MTRIYRTLAVSPGISLLSSHSTTLESNKSVPLLRAPLERVAGTQQFSGVDTAVTSILKRPAWMAR